MGIKQFLKLSILKDKSSKLLSNDNLTIVCDVTVVGPKTTVAEQSTQPKLCQKVEIEDDFFFEDLEAAFLSKEFCDVQLLCGDQVFDCHQFTLSARSPVFRAMFLADMAEKNEQKVDVKDIAPEVLSEMLSFIYFGKLRRLDKFATDLLAAADQYHLDQLKRACEDHLCRNIDIGNCVGYMTMGDMYQADTLKKTSIQFIARNMKKVLKTKVWKESLKNNSSLMVEVLEEFGGEA